MGLKKITFKDTGTELYVSYDNLKIDDALEKIKTYGADLFIVVGIGDMKNELLYYWTGSNVAEKEAVFEILRMVVKQYDINKFTEVKTLK